MYFFHIENYIALQPVDIKSLRRRLGLNQTEFGKAIGVSMRAIQTYESGQSTPSGDIMVKLLELNAHDNVQNMVNEKPGSYKKEKSISITLDNDLIYRKHDFYSLIKFLKRNHEILMDDDLFALYSEFIYNRLDKEKAKESLRKMIEEQKGSTSKH